MKFVLWLVLFITASVSGTAQSPGTAPQLLPLQQLRKIQGTPHRQLPVYTATKVGMPASAPLLTRPADLIQAVRIFETVRTSRAAPRTEPCADSSANKLIGINNSIIYMNTIRHTSDDGVLIGGSVVDSTVDAGMYNGFLVKTDRDGRVVWTRVFGDGNNDRRKIVSTETIYQLKSGDIMVAGSIDTSGTGYNTGTFLLRLDENGNRKWLRTYTSVLARDGQGLDIRAISDGLNGDLLLGTTTFGPTLSTRYATSIRMDAGGNIRWANSFCLAETVLPAEGVSIGMQEGTVVFAGLCNGNGTGSGEVTAAAAFFKFDYATGSELDRKFYAPDTGSPQYAPGKQFSGYAHAAFQENGHIIFYANLLSGTGSLGLPYDHFGVLEVDERFAIVNTYTITSLVPGYLYSSNCFFDEKGRGAFYILSYTGVNYGTDYSGVVQDGVLAKERVSVYPDAGVGIEGTYGQNFKFCFLDDGAFVQSSSYYRDNSAQESFLEFKKMHLSDTSSVCLGHDSIFAWQTAFPLSDPGFAAGSTRNAEISPAGYLINDLLSPGTYELSGCEQQNYCDTLKIHSDSIVCSLGAQQVFTAFRNPACGALVQWDFDTAVIASRQYLSDTSIAVSFRDLGGRTFVRAHLPGGHCRLNPVDSMMVTLVNTPAAVDLGSDTLLCNGTPLTLKPGSRFPDLLWQDGSVSPVFPVLAAGSYSVRAKDVCGFPSSDTIAVRTAVLEDVVLGRDTTICTGQTFTLSLKDDGRTEYLWQDGSASSSYRVDKPGRYRVTATNACGTKAGQLEVGPGLCQLLLPNVFSPNNDGLNDIFRIRYPFSASGYSMQIFDRWGQLIFSTRDMGQGWNGKRADRDQPAGSYVWLVHYTDEHGKKINGSGTVLLVR